jgi:hypothetical protein
MNEELIESNIQVIADGLARDIPESEIIEAYIAAKFEMSDITLLLAAAKLLLHDRKTAPPVKGVFKRAI